MLTRGAAQRYKDDQAKLAKEEAEKKKRVEEQKAKDSAIEEKRKELERQRAAEEAEEQKKIAERLEQLALKEAKVTIFVSASYGIKLLFGAPASSCACCDAAAGEGEY